MNRILISILLTATLFSCTNRSYTLRGTVENPDLNGVVIRIDTFDGENWDMVGEVAIKNQQFILKGVAKEPKMAILFFDDPIRGTRRGKSFILENAKIHFNITEDEGIRMRGSRANNLIQAFDDDLHSIMPQEFIDSMRHELLPRDEERVRLAYFREKRLHLIRDFSKKHVNTLPGTFIFLNNYRSLPLEDKFEILNLMNEATRSNNMRVQSLIQQMEAEQGVAPGQKFVDFTLPTPAGEMLSLSDVVGNHDYVLLHFWASWCPPCIHSFPDLTKFYSKHAGKSFEIFSVSIDSEESGWKNAIERHRLVWQHVSSLQGGNCEVPTFYAIRGIPTTFLIDRNGKIVGRNMSFDEMAELLK